MLGRFIVPWLLKKYLKKVEKNFFNQNSQNFQSKKSKDSNIRIDYSETSDESNKYEDVGEYVDYEEQKD